MIVLSSDLSSWDPSDEVHFQQNFPGTPTTTSSLASGSYTVLPPIGKPTTGTEAELSPGQTGDTACIHRSSSDGYLVQMEKQKQLRTRVTYKVRGGTLNVSVYYCMSVSVI